MAKIINLIEFILPQFKICRKDSLARPALGQHCLTLSSRDALQWNGWMSGWIPYVEDLEFLLDVLVVALTK